MIIGIAALALAISATDCSHPGSDKELAQCWANREEALEPQLKLAVKGAMAAAHAADISQAAERSSVKEPQWLNYPVSYAKNLQRAQKAWQAFLEFGCLSQGDTAMGGSDRNVVYSRCAINLINQRIQQLDDYSKSLTQGR